MSVVITGNNRASRDSVAPPPEVKENGENYAWRMFFEDNRTIADADGVDELLDLLIDGYLQLDVEGRYDARVAHAQRVAQLYRIHDLVEHESELAEWEEAVLSYEDIVFGWGDGTGTLGELDEENPDVWVNSKVKLTLVDVFYAPYTSTPAPISAGGEFLEDSPSDTILWLRPAREADYLGSLHRAGYIVFGRPGAIRR